MSRPVCAIVGAGEGLGRALAARFAGGKFAQYLFRRHDRTGPPAGVDTVRQSIEEAQLFLEATHACQARLAGAPAAAMAATAGEAALTGSPA